MHVFVSHAQNSVWKLLELLTLISDRNTHVELYFSCLQEYHPPCRGCLLVVQDYKYITCSWDGMLFWRNGRHIKNLCNKTLYWLVHMWSITRLNYKSKSMIASFQSGKQNCFTDWTVGPSHCPVPLFDNKFVFFLNAAEILFAGS
jgi:hypothetical protein